MVNSIMLGEVEVVNSVLGKYRYPICINLQTHLHPLEGIISGTLLKLAHWTQDKLTKE